MNDCELLILLKYDAEKGLEKLLELYTATVYFTVKSKLPYGFNKHDIEDCVAQTFCDFYYGIENVDCTKSSIKTLLRTIAVRNVIDLLRKKNTVVCIDDIAEPCCKENVELTVDDHIAKEQMRNAIYQLDKTDREIVLRKYYIGQSSKEIAAIMSMTVTNVDTRTHRAIEKLKKLLKETEL